MLSRYLSLAISCLTLCLVAILASPAPAAAQSGRITDVELLREALYSCRNLAPSRRHQVDLTQLQRMLDLERATGVPEVYRGMTVAKACIESGFTAKISGDCKDGECKAVGMFQLWPWTTRFGVDRTDPVDSARFLLDRVQIGLEGRRLRRRCPNIQSELEAFRLAWLRINRGPLIRGRQRCHGTPHGLTRLRQWKRNIARKRAVQRRNRRRLKLKPAPRIARYSATSAFGDYRPVRRY